MKLEKGVFLALLVCLCCAAHWVYPYVYGYIQNGLNIQYSEATTIHSLHRFSLHLIAALIPFIVAWLIVTAYKTFKKS